MNLPEEVPGASVTLICEVFGVSRAAYYQGGTSIINSALHSGKRSSFFILLLLVGLAAGCAPALSPSQPVVAPEGTKSPTSTTPPPLFQNRPPNTSPEVTAQLPVFTGAEPAGVPPDLKQDWGIDERLKTNGFIVSAPKNTVLDWYRSKMVSWTLVTEQALPGRPGTNESLGFQRYRKGDEGVFILVVGNIMNGKSMLILVEGSWSLVEKCATRFGSSPPPAGGTEPARDTTQPILKNLAVEFGRYDPITGRAGTFLFQKDQDKVFLEFGAKVMGPDGEKTLPTFEYRTIEGATVYAAADGYVTNLEYQSETDDYEILIAPVKQNSVWYVSHDHVKGVSLKVGDRVTAGQVLGTVGSWFGGLGRTELMIGRSNSGRGATYYCPFKLFDPLLVGEYKQKVGNLTADWESFKGDTSIYNESKDVHPGCPYETLSD